MLTVIILVSPESIQLWNTANSLALKSSALLSVEAMPFFVLWVVLPIPGKCPIAAVTFCSCNPVCMPVTKDATVAASVP